MKDFPGFLYLTMKGDDNEAGIKRLVQSQFFSIFTCEDPRKFF